MRTTPFVPHQILPSQMLTRGRPQTPEQRLLQAVIEEAVWTLEGAGSPHLCCQKDAAEAIEWVRDRSMRDAFCFTSICDILGIDPDAARETLSARYEALLTGRTVHLTPARRALLELRARGWSWSIISQRIGVETTRISDWFVGRYKPNPPHQLALDTLVAEAAEERMHEIQQRQTVRLKVGAMAL